MRRMQLLNPVLNPVFGLLLVLAAGPGLSAEAYKWVDEKGVVNYGEKPPKNRPSQQVDTAPKVVIESDSQAAKKPAPAPEKAAAPQASTAPAPAPSSARGMEFDTFIRLQRGMTEAELLQRAGVPDRESVENFRHDIVKSMYYMPTAGNPYITVVTLRGGRIANLERIKQF
jgi:hypothetical protein